MSFQIPKVKVKRALDDEPAELVATMVNWVAAKVARGVPEITHVEGSMESVFGKLAALGDPALMAHEVMAAPLLFNVVGEMERGLPTSPVVPAAFV